MREPVKYSIYALLLFASIFFGIIIPLRMYGGHVHFFAQLTFFEIAVIVGLLIASWISNATRLRILCRRIGQYLGFIDAFLMAGSMVFASVATPWGLGMPVALTYLLEKHGLRLGRCSSSPVAAEAWTRAMLCS
ncbi:MAG: hypothetical protein ACP5SH_13100 [Syntrophobacteraceae bacterium]